MMASQRDYNVAASAAFKLFQERLHELAKANAMEVIARTIVDAVDADRERQKLERDT